MPLFNVILTLAARTSHTDYGAGIVKPDAEQALH
jgi:hypothetical protein